MQCHYSRKSHDQRAVYHYGRRIVGGLDDVVIELNRQAYEQLKAKKHLAVVPGATHLFEEPGALQEVARLAARWFTQNLRGNSPV